MTTLAEQVCIDFAVQNCLAEDIAALKRAMTLSHLGAHNGIRCADLAKRLGCTERRVRKLVSEARFEGFAIVGTPQTGYYVAESPDDIREFTEFHWHRARHSLAIVSRVKKVALPELLGQLQLEETAPAFTPV